MRQVPEGHERGAGIRRAARLRSFCALPMRQALRPLRRRPLSSGGAVAVLAVAIGTATSVLAVVRGVLLQPLAYPEPEALVAVWARLPGVMERSPLTSWDLVQLRREASSLSGVAGFYQNGTVVHTEAGPTWLTVARTTTNLFDVLGLRPVAGRLFASDDAATPVAVISHRMFEERFGGRRDHLREGRLEVRVRGRSRTVVGVLPAGLEPLPSPQRHSDPIDVFVPIRIDSVDPDRSTGWLRVVARARRGLEVGALENDLRSLTAHVRDVIPARAENGFELYALGLLDDAVGAARPALLILFGAGVLMFAVACSNVAGLLVSRAEERRPEMAIRQALGSGRGRLAAHLLAEAAWLAAGGTVLGLWLGAQLLVLARRVGLLDLPRSEHVLIDGPAVATAAGLALAAMAAASVMAAWRAIGTPSSLTAVRSGARIARSSGPWLIAAEMALTFVLLIVSALLLANLIRLREVNPGFDAEGVLTFDIALSRRHTEQEAGWRWLEQLEDRIRTLPGVTEVGLVNKIPLGGGLRTGGWATESSPDRKLDDDGPMVDYRFVSPGYLDAMGSRLLEGRGLRYDDVHRVVVDRRAAARIWPQGSVLGRRLKLAPFWRGEAFVERWYEVVGVVETVHHESLVGQPRGAVFFPARPAIVGTSFVVAVRAAGDPLALIEPLRGLLAELDRDVPMTRARALTSFVDAALAPTRTPLMLVGTFALVAVVLAGVGLYALVTLQVQARHREIGIRMALGARPRSILRDLIGRGLRATAWGIGIGIVSTIALLEPLRALLVEVDRLEGLLCLSIVVWLLALAGLGSWWPARRAFRIDPGRCLRADR